MTESGFPQPLDISELLAQTPAPSTAAALLSATATTVAGILRHGPVAAADLPALIQRVHQAYVALLSPSAAPEASQTGDRPAPPAAAATAEPQAPLSPRPVAAEAQARATSPVRTVFADYIICLEDGRKLKTLKRHLRSAYDLSPEQYRQKWGLPPDYPMTAPNYAKKRSRLARDLGLGKRARGQAGAAGPGPATEGGDDDEPGGAIAAPLAAAAAEIIFAHAPGDESHHAGQSSASLSAKDVFANFPATAPEPAETAADWAAEERAVFGSMRNGTTSADHSAEAVFGTDGEGEAEEVDAPGAEAPAARAKRVPFARQTLRAMAKPATPNGVKSADKG